MILNSFASFFITFFHKVFFLSSKPSCIYFSKILHPIITVSFESWFLALCTLCKACGTLDSICIRYTSVANCYNNCNLSAFFSSLKLSTLYLSFICVFLFIVCFNLKLFATKLSFYQKALGCCLQHIHCRGSLESVTFFIFIYLLGRQ